MSDLKQPKSSNALMSCCAPKLKETTQTKAKAKAKEKGGCCCTGKAA